MSTLIKKICTKAATVLALPTAGICFPIISTAADMATTKNATAGLSSADILRYTLTGIMILLLIVIAVLSNAVIGAGKICWERERKKKSGNVMAKTIFLFMLTGLHLKAKAAEGTEAVAVKTSWMPADISILFIFLALEFLIIFVLARMLQQFLVVKTEQSPKRKGLQWKLIFQKLNQTVALEEEQSLDLAHNYDGIRELDNKVPAWWQYAFLASFIFGVVYMYRMFVSETLPGQLQELQVANRVAELQKAEYLRNAANNIDENNVVLLDASGIAAGSVLYGKNCQACHGDKGQGGVGPNLTDDYWLHNGGIKDIFRSIKYGWQEKGMKSWKDDFSPAQIAQLASYVKSLHGTNPPSGKEPQGTLFTETATAAGIKDTTRINL